MGKRKPLTSASSSWRKHRRADGTPYPSQVPEVKWARHIERAYGITAEQYYEQLDRQGGACALCGGQPQGSMKKFHVDHDHETGRFRGLLCYACNTSLARLGDDEEGILRALAYVRGEAVEDAD